MTYAAPPRVPGYRLGEELGRGGMGVVYVAHRLDDDTEWAVKLVRTDLGEAHLRRLRTEARKAAAVVHPGVVEVREVGEHDGVVWLVMPRIDGRDLQRRLEESGPLPPQEAARLLGEVAEAVASVHAAGLVHRDLKPANVLLDNTGELTRARVTDFGVATAAPDAPVHSQSSAVFAATGDLGWTNTGTGSGNELTAAGTVAYMSPEQWRGDPATVRSDVYALGGTLYAALTGRRPYPQQSLTELAYAVAVAAAPKPSDFGAPQPFDAVVATAMAKDPAVRYPSADAFGSALRAAAQGRSLPFPRVPGARRRRWWLVAATVAVLVVAGAVFWLWPGASPAEGPAHVQRTVCSKTLTLRDHPGGGGKTLHSLPHGTLVDIDRTRDQGAWSYVRTNTGATGWVLNQFLRDSC